jgi:hypothetical protein
MNKHTPGPWSVVRIYNGFIDKIGPLSAEDYKGVSYLDVTSADAALIAAAPDLLEALKLLHDAAGSIKADQHMLATYPKLLVAVRVADIAISKATGEQP